MDLVLYDGVTPSEKHYRRYFRAGRTVVRLHLQFGFGMMEHSKSLVREWSGGEVILSPRDLTDEQLRRLASGITCLAGGSVLLDPQFYLPHADHERLRDHRYWPKEYATGSFFNGSEVRMLLRELAALNERLDTRAFVLPGLLASNVNADWWETQRIVLEECRALSLSKPLIQTLALSDDAGRSTASICSLLEFCAENPAEAYYIVAEHPRGDYLVDDPSWLANIIDLCAGLKLQGASVILGYSNQQMLLAALAKVDAVASGTWMNVRAFPPEKFKSASDDPKQRATWCYCPRSLSEYKLPYLDIAYRQGLLGEMFPDPEHSPYISNLLTGGQPTAIGLTEQSAFRHYLHCLRSQALALRHETFEATVRAYEELLGTAGALLARLNKDGVRGQNRDFSDILDVNRAAMAVLLADRGSILRRLWAKL